MIIDDEDEIDEELEDWISIEREEDERRRARPNAEGNEAHPDNDEIFRRQMDIHSFMSRRYKIKDTGENASLKNALKNHLWKLKGTSKN